MAKRAAVTPAATAAEFTGNYDAETTSRNRNH